MVRGSFETVRLPMRERALDHQDPVRSVKHVPWGAGAASQFFNADSAASLQSSFVGKLPRHQIQIAG